MQKVELMKHVVMPFLIVIGGLGRVFGQQAYVEDFTAEDLQGNSVHLYERLDAGRTVVIFVTTAWSTLSWQYHSLGDLESLYQQYGPSGTGEFDVIMVEAELGNTMDQIMGVSAGSGVLSSAGDWTAGVSYPIVDDASLATLLGVNFYPSLYMICPDRRLTQIGAVSAAEILQMKQQQGCEPAASGADAALIKFESISGNCSDSNFMLRCVIQNKGSQTLTGGTLAITSDLLDLNYSYTGSLATFAFDTLDVGPVFLATADTLLADISVAEDVVPSNNLLHSRIGIPASTTRVRVTIRTDLWPGETSWQILDSNGEEAASGGPYTSMANQMIVRDVYLQATGCYTFRLLDSGGDGLHGAQWGANNGFCRVYGMDEDNTILPLIFDYDGTYNLSIAEQEFVVNQVVGVQELASTSGLKLFPNPVKDELSIAYTLSNAAMVRLEYYSAMGTLVFGQSEGFQVRGDYTAKSSLSALAQGVYLVKIYLDDNHVSTHRIIKATASGER